MVARPRRIVYGTLATFVLILAAGGFEYTHATDTAKSTVSATAAKATSHASQSATNFTSMQLIAAWKSAVAGRTGVLDIAIQDLSTGQVMHYTNAAHTSTFATASIVKLSILEKLLQENQTAGQSLSVSQLALATTMIEDSDNDAATALWKKIGGTAAMNSFYKQIGATATIAGSQDYWGLTKTTALDQLKVLGILQHPGKVLSAASITTIDGLLGNVDSAQSWGVSGGVPTGVSVELKNGWLMDALIDKNSYASTNDWLVNSVGIVSGNGTKYAIAVLTDGNQTEQYGIDTIHALSSATWQELAN